MADILRIKRRTGGSPGAPSSLANAELAYNETDHILYYGEGTGGAGGTATVIVGIGGNGLGQSVTLPLVDAPTALTGSSASWSRSDHVHPTDTSRAPTASPSFTGVVTIGGTITGAGMTAFAATPPPIGNATANTGAFTTLTASGTVSGAGFTALLAGYATSGSLPVAATVAPLMDAATAVIGVGTRYAREDHVHPSDTSKANVAGPTLTGTTTVANLTATGTVSGAGFTTLLTPYALISAIPLAATGAMLPLMNGAQAVGVGTNWARNDHVHPSDTSRAPLASPVFTGNPQSTTPPANTDNSISLATTSYVKGQRLDQFQAPTTDVSWNNFKITNLNLTPSAGGDAACKAYVDSVAQGLAAKDSSRVATTANLAALSGLLTIDGITVIAGDRVLVKNQTLAQNNGIYVAASGAWARSADADIYSELISAFTFITEGTVNGGNGYICNAASGGTLGTTPLPWSQFSSSGQVIAGGGLTKTGSQLDVGGTANRIVVLADSIDIDPVNYVGQASITTLGSVTTGSWNATTIAVNRGGTGATTFTAGYLKASGTSSFTTSASVPNTDITGLGTMSTQNANAVAITGGTIDGITLDGGTF